MARKEIQMQRRHFVALSAFSAIATAIKAIAVPTKEINTMAAHSLDLSPAPLHPLQMIVSPDDVPVYQMNGGGEARLLATAETTNGAWFMGRFREDPGFMTPLHVHPHTDEQVYVLEGVLSVYIDDKWHELRPGTLGVLPRGKPHAQGNRSDKPVHLIGTGAPGGFEKLFPSVDALMKRMKPGTPEYMEELKKIMTSCGVITLGPAPV
jgi:quercetin dioxygenase-like cupin family protein